MRLLSFFARATRTIVIIELTPATDVPARAPAEGGETRISLASSIQVYLEPDHLQLTLGERASVEVEVFNASSVVEEFTVDLVGPAVDPIRPEWVTAQPPLLALFPNSSGVVTLTFDAPAASQLLAGSHVAGVRVRSTTDPDHVHVAELPLVINSQPVVSVHLEPQAVSGGRTARTALIARNLGNIPVSLRLASQDPAGAIEFALGSRETLLPTDEEMRIPIGLRARRPLFGGGVTRPYHLTAEIEDRADEVGAESQTYVEPVRAEGVFTQRPWVSGRVLTMIGTVLPVVAILIAAVILRPPTEAPDLTGPLVFGVAGEVRSIDARAGETVLAGRRLASLDPTEAMQALEAAQLELRRAILELEGLKTERLVADARALLDGNGSARAGDLPFLEALADELQTATENAVNVSSTALTGLSDAFNAFCATLETPWPECATTPLPLPASVLVQLSDAAATEPAARRVLDASSNYRAASTTSRTLQQLLDLAKDRVAAAGGDPDEPRPPSEVDERLAAALALLAEQQEQEFELALLDARARIAEAQLACRAALDNVGRTVLRAPVDVHVVQISASGGTHVDADTPVVVLERTDGRAFIPPPGQRPPSRDDLPAGANCPGSLDEQQVLDAGLDEGNGNAEDGK